jgi:hypothetical protein
LDNVNDPLIIFIDKSELPNVESSVTNKSFVILKSSIETYPDNAIPSWIVIDPYMSTNFPVVPILISPNNETYPSVILPNSYP